MSTPLPGPAFNGLYGVLPRADFEAQYRRMLVTRMWDKHGHVQRLSLEPDDVLMEPVEGHPDYVRVYQTDVMPYPWRTLWRKRARQDTAP